MNTSPSKYFFIGSLRMRITALLAGLTIAVQVAFLLDANKTASEFNITWQDTRAAQFERMIPTVNAAVYRSLDEDLQRLIDRIVEVDLSNPNAIEWTIASLAYEVLKIDVQQVFVHDEDGTLLFPSAGSSLLAEQWLKTTERFKSINRRKHSGYFDKDVAFLTSTKSLSMPIGKFLISIATLADESLVSELNHLTGTHNSIVPVGQLSTTDEPKIASLTFPIHTFPEASIVSVLPDSAPISDLISNQYKRLMVLLVSSLIAILAISLMLASQVTKPLQLLVEATKRIKDGDYSEKVPQVNGDEIGALAKTIDTMREQVAEREEEILQLAYADSLTGLPNRALFDDRLNQAVRMGKRSNTPFAVLMLDMDRFKYINDVLGHEAGDKVLQEVGTRLGSALRESDTVARLGGDEFSLLMLADSDLDILVVVEKAAACFEKPVILNNQPVDVACSIGIAKFPQHGDDASTLLRRADMAMYSAKRSDLAYAFFDVSCDEHQEKHLSLLSEIKQAIEADELVLFFQPKVNFGNDRTVEVETLLRWQHPSRGLIPPDQFIPFAEQTGAIRLITRWVVKKALKQANEWQMRNLKVKVSLNISARDLIDSDFVQFVQSMLDLNSIDPNMVCMEITESALMEDPVKARRTVEQLNNIGVSISIDDYGTGYSSLAYVKNLQVSELKIDREFIKNMLESEEDVAIIRSTIELGHNLGMRVVAEGIERVEEMQMLKEFGCDQAQGYLISRALTATDIEQWINNNNSSADSYFTTTTDNNYKGPYIVNDK